MSEVTVKQASLLTGKTKETINKATNDGTLSVSRNDRGHKLIAVSELERVFPLVKTMDEISGKSDAVRSGQKQSDRSVRSDSEALQNRILHLEHIADLLNNERLRERGQMQDQIDNLQSTLSKVQEHHSKSILVLTDQTQERAGHYEQAIDRLNDKIDGQSETFDQVLSDVKTETRLSTIKEVKDYTWWGLVWELAVGKKLQA